MGDLCVLECGRRRTPAARHEIGHALQVALEGAEVDEKCRRVDGGQRQARGQRVAAGARFGSIVAMRRLSDV